MKTILLLAFLACLQPIWAVSFAGVYIIHRRRAWLTKVLDASDESPLLYERDELYDSIDVAFDKRDGATPFKCSPPEPPSDNAKRELEIEYYDPAGNGTQVRRTLKMPESTSPKNIDEYVQREIGAEGFKKIVWSTTYKKRKVDMNTSKAVEFNSKKAVSIGTDGLCGCTVLAIVSRKGVYMGHYWESISFHADSFWKKYYDVDDDEDVFKETVIKGLEDGIPRTPKRKSWDQPSLTDYKELFDGEDTYAYLMIPESAVDENDQQLYKEKFEDRWQQIKATVNKIIPVLQDEKRWVEHKYYPRRFKEEQQRAVGKAWGTALLQYDPMDKPGSGDVKSRKRMVMWMERTKMFDDIWDEKK
jgi:hypothetical protein